MALLLPFVALLLVLDAIHTGCLAGVPALFGCIGCCRLPACISAPVQRRQARRDARRRAVERALAAQAAAEEVVRLEEEEAARLERQQARQQKRRAAPGAGACSFAATFVNERMAQMESKGTKFVGVAPGAGRAALAASTAAATKSGRGAFAASSSAISAVTPRGASTSSSKPRRREAWG